MKEEEILDSPKVKIPQVNKWKWALLSVLFLSIVTVLFFLYIKTNFQELFFYLVIIGTMYFFIKKVNPNNLSNQELFFWSSLITFSSFFITSLLIYFLEPYAGGNYLLSSIFPIIGLTIVFGYIPAVGVYHFVKNKNWAMLVLMIAISLMLLATMKGFLS